MADASSDVLMKMVGAKGPILAESQTVFDAGKVVDPLRTDFQPGQFCELLSFEFTLGVEPSKKPGSGTDAAGTETAEAKAKREAQAALSAGKPVDMQPVRFTRILDMASPRLFQALVDCETLASIAIIKRKAASTTNSGEAYLRLDFTKVLITELEWEDKDHYVEETGTFIFRQLQVRYRQQKPDGSLGVPIPMQWKMTA